ncbi:hypothetical protein PanWU01x14_241690 [Parasponia andersonii]|uniref:Uncharacterized protein n=1 Tax=Parasponia andersonii TaxID=3476 RepID=A0A2P5BG50_PARAD|nr:hypothetical protein PanWU01x14_241690 [Parasponia andersonii]
MCKRRSIYMGLEGFISDENDAIVAIQPHVQEEEYLHGLRRIQGQHSRDPLSLLSGPIIRLRAKRFKENSTVELSLFRVIVGDGGVVYFLVKNEDINIIANGRLAIRDLGEIGNSHLVAENGFIQGPLCGNVFVNGNIGNQGITNCGSGGGKGGVPEDVPGTPNPLY